jgi:hypothetical protein
MKLYLILFLSLGILHAAPEQGVAGEFTDLARDNEALFCQLQAVHDLTEGQMAAVRAILAKSGYIGQGNPAITMHPATVEQCEAKLRKERVDYENPGFVKICGGKYMAPLYNPATEKPEDACVCIDQFEFPNIPCAYPVVWVRAKEAAELCEALGKRLCDAHEWEGACAGSLEAPDYPFDLVANKSPEDAIRTMRNAHNSKYSGSKSWSYGPEYRTGICATSSHKSPG